MKKFLLILCIFGGVLIIAGALFNPGILAKFGAAGVFRSDWMVVKIQVLRYFAMIIGLTIIIESLVISRFSTQNRRNHFLLGLAVVGVAISIIGIIFSPLFIEKIFSPIKFLEDHNMVLLSHYQLLTITLGFILILIAAILIKYKYNSASNKYRLVAIVAVAAIYLLTVNETYLKLKYPLNIFTNPSEYGKVFNLLMGKDILLSDFDPKSTLIVKNKQITKAKYPVIDMNFHLNSTFMTDYDRNVLAPDNLVKTMDALGVKIIVNTDGIAEKLKQYVEKYPERFINFCGTWFPARIMSDEDLANLSNDLERKVKMGCRGNGEIWKYFGLKTRDASGNVIPLDDPRLDPLWDKAADLDIPIIWHLGDPASFFQPVNRFNERLENLIKMPDWSFYGPRFPSREEIIKQRENVFRKHPKTIFIGAHLGYDSHNLDYVGHLLDSYPNYYVEISTVLSDLGRQPFTARKFFIKYQDRILFGTDGGNNFGERGWSIEKYYRTYFEFLETENENFDYPLQGVVNQGNWKIFGINLPDEVLEKIYYKNAEKILFKTN